MNVNNELFGSKSDNPGCLVCKIFIGFHEEMKTFSNGIVYFIRDLNSFIGLRHQIATISITDYTEINAEDRFGSVEFSIPTELLSHSGGISHILAVIYYYAPYKCVRTYFVDSLEFSYAAIKILKLPITKTNKFASDGVIIGVVEKPRFKAFDDDGKYLKWVFDAGFEVFVEDEISVHSTVREAIIVAEKASRIIDNLGIESFYIINLTMRPVDAISIARKLKKIPHIGIMINVVTMGFDLITDLRRILPKTPIVANVIGRDIMCGQGNYYIREKIVCQLARLAGADAVYTGPFVEADIQTGADRANAIRSSLNSPLFDSKPHHKSLAVISGGLDFQKVLSNFRLYQSGVISLFGTEAWRLYESEATPDAIRVAIETTRESLNKTDEQFNLQIFDNLSSKTNLKKEQIKEIFKTI